MSEKIVINDKEYNVDELSDDVKVQIINLQTAENKIKELQNEIAMLNAAKIYYNMILNKLLEENSEKTNQNND